MDAELVLVGHSCCAGEASEAGEASRPRGDGSSPPACSCVSSASWDAASALLSPVRGILAGVAAASWASPSGRFSVPIAPGELAGVVESAVDAAKRASRIERRFASAPTGTPADASPAPAADTAVVVGAAVGKLVAATGVVTGAVGTGNVIPGLPNTREFAPPEPNVKAAPGEGRLRNGLLVAGGADGCSHCPTQSTR